MIELLKGLRANTTNEEGFTLIELMIVVVIIGILAAIALPIFANQQKEAIFASVKSDVKNAATEVTLLEGKGYRIDSGNCDGFGEQGRCEIQVETGTMGSPVRSTATIDAAVSEGNMLSIHRTASSTTMLSNWWLCGFTPGPDSPTRAFGYNPQTGKTYTFESHYDCQDGNFSAAS